MINKKLFLFSIFALATATAQPATPENPQAEMICVEQSTARPLDLCKMYAATVISGAAVGGFTGTSIGYLSGKIFDIIAHSIEMNDRGIKVARLIIQFGCKWYWEKPLRNKIMNWVLADIKNHSVTCNEELAKTIARVSAYIGTATQL